MQILSLFADYIVQRHDFCRCMFSQDHDNGLSVACGKIRMDACIDDEQVVCISLSEEFVKNAVSSTYLCHIPCS